MDEKRLAAIEELFERTAVGDEWVFLFCDNMPLKPQDVRDLIAAAKAECERLRQELDHARDWLKESRENGQRLLEAADGWKLAAAEWKQRAESAEADAERISKALEGLEGLK